MLFVVLHYVNYFTVLILIAAIGIKRLRVGHTLRFAVHFIWNKRRRQFVRGRKEGTSAASAFTYSEGKRGANR